MKELIEYSKEVQGAREMGKPIVALESTIISHGMPYPQNVKTAKEVEEIIRQNGAVPATIAIIDGKIKIGLSDEELEFLGQNKEIVKTSRRDIPYLVSQQKHGATTVSATMICAELADIHVFVTGGIGGVHRGAETTMDISADLEELARTNVAVVCAGAKSILDLGLTMEYLETHGVPVLGYQTETLPGFYSRTSEYKVNYQVDTPEETAALMKAKWDLGLSGGLIVANPVPESHAMEESAITAVIEQAIEEAKQNGIAGKNVTPFLLGKIKELTDGKSLDTNIALVKNNAEIGSRIAVAFAK